MRVAVLCIASFGGSVQSWKVVLLPFEPASFGVRGAYAVRSAQFGEGGPGDGGSVWVWHSGPDRGPRCRARGICMALTVTRIAMYLMRPEAERTRGA